MGAFPPRLLRAGRSAPDAQSAKLVELNPSSLWTGPGELLVGGFAAARAMPPSVGMLGSPTDAVAIAVGIVDRIDRS